MASVYHRTHDLLGAFPHAPRLGLLPFASVAEGVGGWSTFFLAWITILAIYGTLLGVLQTRRDNKRARTLEYMRRMDDGTFAPLNAQVQAFLRSADPGAFVPGARIAGELKHISPAEIGQAYGALDIETRARVILVLNFYEEVSASFDQGLLDERLALQMILPSVAYAWELAEPLVESLRSQTISSRSPEVGSKLMENLENLSQRYKKRKDAGWAGRDLLERLDAKWVRMLSLLALLLVIGGLVAVVIAAAAHHAPGTTESFLVAVAAALAVMATVALVPMVEPSSSFRRMAVIGVAAGILALLLTVGIATALDLASPGDGSSTSTSTSTQP